MEQVYTIRAIGKDDRLYPRRKSLIGKIVKIKNVEDVRVTWYTCTCISVDGFLLQEKKKLDFKSVMLKKMKLV